MRDTPRRLMALLLALVAILGLAVLFLTQVGQAEASLSRRTAANTPPGATVSTKVSVSISDAQQPIRYRPLSDHPAQLQYRGLCPH